MFCSLAEAMEYHKERNCYIYPGFDEVFESHDWEDHKVDFVAECRKCGLCIDYEKDWGIEFFYSTTTISEGQHVIFSRNYRPARPLEYWKCSRIVMAKALS